MLFAAIVACHAMFCGWTDAGSRRSWSSLDAFRPLLMYCLAALPFAIALGYYNWYFLGSPFVLAKTQAAHFFAEAKLGNPNLWQTPFLVGFAGLLCSPVARCARILAPANIRPLGSRGRLEKETFS